MSRTPKPWWRKERRSWFVMLDNQQVNLGPDRDQAFITSIPSTLRVGHLRPYHVQRFVDAMSVSSGTKRNYVRAVKRAMIWAEE